VGTKSPNLLTPEQRAQFVRIPSDLSDRDIARFYTFTPDDLAVIKQRRRSHNRLGFAVQLAVLRFPGRTITDLPAIPPRVLAYIAHQVEVPVSAFARYGSRQSTVYEHLDELRVTFGYTNYSWRAVRRLLRHLLPLAMESDRPLPLIEAALDDLRRAKIIAPGMTTLEQVVWHVQRRAERHVYQLLCTPLSLEQQAALNALLVAQSSRSRFRGTTQLHWLRIPPGTPSGAQLVHLLERIAFLQALDLPPLTPQLHLNRVRQLAQRASRTGAQPLAKLPDARRMALLVTYLHELQQDLVDLTLDMFDDVWIELMRKGAAEQDQQVAEHTHELNLQVHILTAVAEALLQAEADQLDPLATVYAAVPKDLLVATVAHAKALVRPIDFDYLDLVEPKYVPLRQSLLQLYHTLQFQSFRRRDPALLALAHVARLAQRKQRVTSVTTTIGRTTVHAPLAHVTERWRRHVLDGTTIHPNHYEAAAFDRLRVGLRSGDIAVVQSRRYRPFESYLLPRDHWAHLCATGASRLAITEDAPTYLAERQERIHTQLTALQAELGSTSGLTVEPTGTLSLARLEGVVPPTAKALSRRCYRLMPRMDLVDLVREVNLWTDFLDCATHQITGLPLAGDEALPVLAAILASGLNIGLTAMAKASGFSEQQLAWASDWFLHDAALHAMLVKLDNFILHQPLSQVWGDGTRSSSDGLRVRLGVKAANADRNSEYFDDGRGITIYLHLADVGPPFRQRVISTNESEAWYVIDGLCNHETEFNIREHATDTGGSSEHVFGMCALLGFRFTPRLAAPLTRQLWTIGKPPSYGPLDPLLKGRVSTRLIMEHWEEVKHLAGSIRHGATPASVLMRKLAAYPRQNQVAQTLAEVGKVEQTLHLIEWFRDATYRRRVEVRLDRHEGANALGRALFFGRRGIMRDRAFQDQMHRASCLVILMAAIIAWNTVYLTDAVDTIRGQGVALPDDLLPHIAPLGWRHINFLGRYSFKSPIYSLHARRPLRSGSVVELDEPPDDDGNASVGYW